MMLDDNVSVPGYWWSPDRPDERFAGALTTEPLRTPTLRIVDPHDRSSDLHGRGRIPMLHGFAEDLGPVTLIDLMRTGLSLGGATSHRFTVWQMLTGVWLSRPDEKFFRTVELVAPNLGYLLGTDWPRSRPPEVVDRTVSFSAESPERLWIDGDLQVTVSLDWRYSASADESKVTHRAVARFSSSRPKSLQSWTGDWLVPFNDLVRVATGVDSRFESVRLWHKKHLAAQERSQTAMSLFTAGVGEHEIEKRHMAVLGRLQLESPSQNDLLLAIRRADGFRERHDIFQSRLATVLNEPQRPTQNRYLDLMGAIEALAGGLIGTDAIPKSEYKKLRRATRAELQTDVSRDFFDLWMASQSYYGLNKQIDALRGRLSNSPDWSVTTRRMVKLRNDLAHGNADVDATYLDEAFGQALALCRQLFVQESGFPVV